MSIRQRLGRLQQHYTMQVPGEHLPLSWLQEKFGSGVKRTDDAWLIPCRHTFQAPAPEERLVYVEKELGFALPPELKELLSLTDGADLFALCWHHTSDWREWIASYHVLRAAELLKWYQVMLDECRRDPDPNYRHVTDLNYVPFCDIGDGSFLAVLRTGALAGRVIYVDRGFALGYHPYDDWTSEGYPIIADSLGSWLQHLIDSGGWGGLGERAPL